MKGNIQLGEFIHQVKQELLEAQREDEPFYELNSVELEVSFVLETSGKAKGQLLVVSAEGEFKGQQSHKVTLQLTPLPPNIKSNTASPELNELTASQSGGSSSGGAGRLRHLEDSICYDRDRMSEKLGGI